MAGIASEMAAAFIQGLAEDEAALEVGRKAIEDVLVEFRDSRISEPFRGNGFVIREKDGNLHPIIRFGPEAGLGIALRAIAEHLRKAAVTK